MDYQLTAQNSGVKKGGHALMVRKRIQGSLTLKPLVVRNKKAILEIAFLLTHMYQSPKLYHEAIVLKPVTISVPKRELGCFS
jgi:hypothetical protein